MATILLLADETHGARLKSDLEYIGYSVHHAILQGQMDPQIGTALPESIDLIFIDPEASLDRLTQAIQTLSSIPPARQKPVLVVTDEMTALNLDFSQGIADFIVKPYSLREVEARLRLALWNDDRPGDDQTLKIDELTINLDRYEVRIKGQVIELTLKEYELLKHLVSHKGRVFTRSDLLDSIWGYDYYGGMRTVDVHIRRLRSKLGDIGNNISTVRGVGYKFDRI
ncbi:MAG: response regulator transcription factor [bacterium]|nr:response regulator transcription factor [bacterium]